MSSKQTLLWGILIVVLAGLAAANLLRGGSARLFGGQRQEQTGVAGRARVEGGAAAGEVVGGAPGLAVYGDVPDFHLVSQTGDSVRLADLRGGLWIGDFIFTHCASSCPMMSAELQKLEAALGKDSGVRLVSFSVDPERDTPARLAEYAKGYGATPDRWLFLTGDRAAVRKLAVEGFKVTVDDPSPEDVKQGAEAVMHSTRLALVDGLGRIRGYYDGTDAKAMQQLGKDVRTLLARGAS